MKRILVLTLTIMVAFSFMPGFTGDACAAVKKPAKVKFAKCISTKSSVTLKWKKTKKAKKYEVYQLKAKKYKKIKTVKKTKFTVKKLKANTVYKFKVRGVNGKKKGKLSAVKKIRTKKTVKKIITKNDTTINTNTNHRTDTSPISQGSITDVYFANNSTSVNVGKSIIAKLLVEVKGNGKPVASNFTVKTNNGNIAATVTGIGGGVSESYYASVKIIGKTAGSSTVTVSGYGFSDNIDVYINANTNSNNDSANSSNNNSNTGHNNTNENDNASSVQPVVKEIKPILFTNSSVTTSVDSNETLYLTNPSYATTTYTSSNASVVTIERFSPTWVVVNAKKAGKAIVTAKAGDKTAACTVTVTNPSTGSSSSSGGSNNSGATTNPSTGGNSSGGSNNSSGGDVNGGTSEVALQSISFNKSSLEMEYSDYQILNVSYSPSNTTVDKKNIKYSVSDSNVLSINNSGSTSVSIKSVGYGTATVTATLDGKTAQCTVTVLKPEPKYSYEIYKLENQDIYYDYNNILIKEPYYKYSKGPLLVITDNPKPNDYENGYISSIVPYDYSAEDGNYTSCFGEFKKPSELKNKYYDIMNIPDQTADGKYVYYVYGTIFKEDADKPFVVCEQDQCSGIIKTTTRKWDLNIKSYVDDFHNWLDEIISANDDGNPPERMSKIATYLKNYASYNPTGYPYYCIDSSLKLNTLSTWKAKYWDSKYYAPHYYVGQKLGFTNITEQTGKLHAFVKMDWNGETYSYSITPNQNNVKLISEYCPQLSLADYRIINSH